MIDICINSGDYVYFFQYMWNYLPSDVIQDRQSIDYMIRAYAN